MRPCHNNYKHYSLSPIYTQASAEVYTLVQVVIETWTRDHVRIQIQSTVYRRCPRWLSAPLKLIHGHTERLWTVREQFHD